MIKTNKDLTSIEVILIVQDYFVIPELSREKRLLAIKVLKMLMS